MCSTNITSLLHNVCSNRVSGQRDENAAWRKRGENEEKGTSLGLSTLINDSHSGRTTECRACMYIIYIYIYTYKMIQHSCHADLFYIYN